MDAYSSCNNHWNKISRQLYPNIFDNHISISDCSNTVICRDQVDHCSDIDNGEYCVQMYFNGSCYSPSNHSIALESASFHNGSFIAAPDEFFTFQSFIFEWNDTSLQIFYHSKASILRLWGIQLEGNEATMNREGKHCLDCWMSRMLLVSHSTWISERS